MSDFNMNSFIFALNGKSNTGKPVCNEPEDETFTSATWDSNGNLVDADYSYWEEEKDQEGNSTGDYNIETKDFNTLTPDEQAELLAELETCQNEYDCYVDMYNMNDDEDYYSMVSSF